MEEKLEDQGPELISLTLHISEIEEQFTKLKSKNLSLMSQLEKVNDSDDKGKKEASRLPVDLEERLRDF